MVYLVKNSTFFKKDKDQQFLKLSSEINLGRFLSPKAITPKAYINTH